MTPAGWALGFLAVLGSCYELLLGSGILGLKLVRGTLVAYRITAWAYGLKWRYVVEVSYGSLRNACSDWMGEGLHTRMLAGRRKLLYGIIFF